MLLVRRLSALGNILSTSCMSQPGKILQRVAYYIKHEQNNLIKELTEQLNHSVFVSERDQMDTLGTSVLLGHLEKTEARSVMNPNRNLFVDFKLAA